MTEIIHQPIIQRKTQIRPEVGFSIPKNYFLKFFADFAVISSSADAIEFLIDSTIS
jgi:hypothetical protein